MTIRHIAAVDLGASSGRVMLARFDSESGSLMLEEHHRFVNQQQQRQNYQCWDIDALEADVVRGLTTLPVVPDSLGIDTWGVDLVMLDKQGKRLGPCVSYRDVRTDGVLARAQRELGRDWLYQRTGIQFLPFNTLYQLRAFADAEPQLHRKVAHALMIPDYLAWRLTGKMNWEYTNATTTQLLNLQSGQWDPELLDWCGAKAAWFGAPCQPGNQVGLWQPAGAQPVPVVAVATHDTASAVLATPLGDEDSLYLSSGTWSLMGFESPRPCSDAAALADNLTNEGGVEGRYRVLKNIMGLWLLQQVCDELNISDLNKLINDVSQLPVGRSLINPNDGRFIHPASMVREIQDACAAQSMAIPQSEAALARCIFDSLALFYRQVMQRLTQHHGRPFKQIHIVGGGSQNALLNQLCADACQLPVIAGPVEASALGNIGAQLIASGELADAAAFRRCIRQNEVLTRFAPQHNSALAACWPRFQALTQPTKELCI
ncbi:rhamnulokinase [Izhakiella australiensis]|uniref:Rhamnulokinase n=1 Tax=Izhakiella australiensis TaxID=1926881 RepID=A0A1S8YLT2_9GAMM|nr:rhamnulokinase [Izhakiella australiensis]OON39984.1 rhamnulokinase [Izhakiella australiensis]